MPTLAAPAAAPLESDAPLFQSPAVPSLRTPPLPALPPGAMPLAPQSVTSYRVDGQACAYVDVTAGLLNRLFSTPRQDAGPVNDFILGARVEGEQRTQSTVSIRVVPSPTSARLDVLLDGQTCTRTTAVTPQAAVNATGRQTFDLWKPVEFDGSRFITRTPGTSLDTCQQFHQARTRASQIPVINSIAETIALNQANLRQPLARQETAQRVTSRVVPPFNAAIDERLATANQGLNEFQQRFPRLHDWLTTTRWSSTAAMISGQLPGQRAVSTAPPPFRGGACLRVHESIGTALATATDLNGREISVDEIRRWIGAVETEAGGSTTGDLPALSAPSDATLRLADSDPISLSFTGNEIRLVLRASLKAGDVAELPIHQVGIGYSVRHEGDVIRLEPLPVSVSAETAEPLAGGAVEQVIQSQIESRLKPFTISSDAFPAMPNGSKVRITDVTAENGWLTLTID
jgi:hypothetical protein